jgi:Tol biopolymer transport system component
MMSAGLNVAAKIDKINSARSKEWLIIDFGITTMMFVEEFPCRQTRFKPSLRYPFMTVSGTANGTHFEVLNEPLSKRKSKYIAMKKLIIKAYRLILSILAVLVLIVPQLVSAQGFGRNKPSYRTFDFKVFQTPNFEIYHYFTNDSIVSHLANLSEKWYKRHQEIFGDTMVFRNPVILYETHPDFQQTTTVGSNIGIGTQGVTEALKNRVVMPILETNAQTNHVLGHEMVHAFQFNILMRNDSLSLRNIQNLPLWLVEGMAEYLSIGSVDTHTAMIMRDALANDDFPSIRDMTRSYRYNPYRFGHSFVSFVAGTWGDTIIRPLFYKTAMHGPEMAIRRVLKTDHETLSEMWRQSLVAHYASILSDTGRQLVGNRLIFDRTAGEMNISPSYSPDGKHLTFFSEKRLFTLDLYLADASTGKISRRLTSSARNQDIDGFNFFESVGTWSPDSKKFAYVVVSKGKNKLAIINVDRPGKPALIEFEDIPAFNNPSWSPDGKTILFTGQRNGLSDLYIYNLETGRTTRLTDDYYSYVHAAWSPDGRRIVFATDRKQAGDASKDINYNFNLGYLNISEPDQINVIPVFKGADNVNPIFSPDDSSVYFLSNRDGLRNLYEYEFDSGKVYQLTNYATGISGITALSPAISISWSNNAIAYSYFEKGNYSIYSADLNEFTRKEIDSNHIDFSAATLPPAQRGIFNIVDSNLEQNPTAPVFPQDSFQVRPYHPRFKLDYIGNTGVGISATSYGATGAAGGVFMIFSDILGNNQLYTMAALNGEIYDFGAQVSYLNQKHRIKWGGSISHIPYRSSFLRYGVENIGTDEEPRIVETLQLVNWRTFEDQISAFAWYPFSTTRRFEVSAAASLYYYRIDAINNYYQGIYRIGQERERLKDEEPDGFNLQKISAAYVADNSFFGLASPMMGHHFRLQADQYFGRMSLTSAYADYRQYFFVQPFSLAFRAMHYGRYGDDALFYPMFLGYPGMVRGFGSRTLYENNMFIEDEDLINILVGNRIALASAEMRIPLTGPRRLALISSGFLFTEAALFFDSGIAWTKVRHPTLDPSEISQGRNFPVFSTGASIRINLFGAMVLESYYAFPFINKGISKGVWGLNFLPGW